MIAVVRASRSTGASGNRAPQPETSNTTNGTGAQLLKKVRAPLAGVPIGWQTSPWSTKPGAECHALSAGRNKRGKPRLDDESPLFTWPAVPRGRRLAQRGKA